VSRHFAGESNLGATPYTVTSNRYLKQIEYPFLLFQPVSYWKS